MKKETHIYPVLLAGGTGTRLWPVSRKSYPKQFLQIRDNERSLFQKTVLRLMEVNSIKFSPPIIFTAEEYRFIVENQLREINCQAKGIFLEPCSRNTGPSIIAATQYLINQEISGITLVLPTDHEIDDITNFIDCIKSSIENMENDRVFTIGVKPDNAHTGYGYLNVKRTNENGPLEVLSFTEKPSQIVAQKMISSGDYLWNAGMFMAEISHLKYLFALHADFLFKPIKGIMENLKKDLSFSRLDPIGWSKLPSISFDYAIMEKISSIYCSEFKGYWSDMGTWESFWKYHDKDENNCVSIGSVTAKDCKNSLLFSNSDQQELVALGLDQMVVVSTEDALLVGSMSETKSLAPIIDILKENKKYQGESSNKVYRPWGNFINLIKSSNFLVKMISVYSGARLSLQSHKFRSEHWVVVKGIATITLGSQETKVEANQSIYVPLGERHRLANRTDNDLVIIEVQSGTYLDENDIIRYEDDYARM